MSELGNNECGLIQQRYNSLSLCLQHACRGHPRIQMTMERNRAWQIVCWLLTVTPQVTHATYACISLTKTRHLVKSNFKESREMQFSHVLARRGNWMFLNSSGGYTDMLNLRYSGVRKDRPNNLEEVRHLQR